VIQSGGVDVVSLYDDDWTDGTEEPGFRNRERPLAQAVGAEKLGGTVYLIEPEQRICPYHWHFGEEEWLIVLEGTVAIRTPGGRASSPGGTCSRSRPARAGPTTSAASAPPPPAS
jgi:uncharacterized cupin superfamily protein